MADSRDDALARITKLEARVEELEAVQGLTMRLLSTTRPLAVLLQHYGATETQEQAFQQLLESLSERVDGSERTRPTFVFFELRVCEIFPQLRGDREFIQLVIDTLRVERPAYRALHRYMIANGWPPSK